MSLRPGVVVGLLVGGSALACTCDPGRVVGGGGGAPSADEEPARRAPRAKGKRPPSEAPDGGEAEMPAGVEYLGDDEWRVQRAVANRYVEDPDRLGCSAREKGKGYELVGVQPADDAYALGARNRDVLLTVNGQSLDDPADLLNLYVTLQDADQLTVVLERAGARRTHRYHLTD